MCVRAFVILFRITVKISSSRILKSPGVKQASKQASRQASKPESKQVSRQASTKNAFSRRHALEGLVF